MQRDDLNMIAEGLERMLTDSALEGDALWAALTEMGYPRLCAGEDHGGYAGSYADAVEIALLAGRYALPLPLVDTTLATGLLSAVGCEAPSEPLALLDPMAPGAPLAHATQAQAVVMLREGRLICARLSGDLLTPLEKVEDGAAYLSHDPKEVLCDSAAPDWMTPRVVQALGALMRAASMAGAMQAVLDLTLDFTQNREQFGRPLSKFQAIQHHLSDIACEAAAASAAVEIARDALAADPECGARVLQDIAVAKTRCGEAVTTVAAAAHQAHGAMGFTREYALGRFTRRLWQWQDEFGHESEWAQHLGASILAEDEPQLWRHVSQPI